jgi:hypothetical protein
MRRLLLCFAVMSLAAPVTAQTGLYLVEYAYNNPKLKTMLLDGSGLQELTAPPPSDWLQVGLGYDPGANRLYWVHGSTPGLIRRADADGSHPVLLVSGLKLPRGIALDLVNGWMYWSEAPPQGNAMGLIRRARLDGSDVQTIYALDPYDPTLSYVGKPIVDPTNGCVYFGAANEIRRIRLDGGTVQTVVRGVNAATALALDVAGDRIFFLDANTNSDILGCARLNDTEFRVLVDNTPGLFTSSGLFDLELGRDDPRAYFTDELAKTVRRCGPDGQGLETIYTGPATLYPTGLALDADPAPPMQDCNGNLVRDLDDVESGTSEDCNANGIPDECEEDPCAPIEYGLDNGSDPGPAGRTLSGNPNTGFEVFQPFDVVTLPEVPGVTVREIGLDGWTVNHHADGFRATIFPDDGSGTFPDEDRPLGWADAQFRFSPNTVVWVYRELDVFLAPGRYYVRLTANAPQYDASVNLGTSGEPSFSRRLSDGHIIPATASIALRLRLADASSVPDGAGPRPGPPGGDELRIGLGAPTPNPAAAQASVAWRMTRAGRLRLQVLDPAGRTVRTLHDGWGAAGDGHARWDGRDDGGREVPSGVYVLRITAEAPELPLATATRRLVVLR